MKFLSYCIIKADYTMPYRDIFNLRPSKIKPSRHISSLLLLVLLLVSLSQPAAAATECTDLPSGSVASIAGRIVSNNGEIVVCKNGSWVPFLKYKTNGDVTGIGNATCAADQVLKFDGTKFICADDNAGGGGSLAPECKADMSNIQIGDTCDDGSKFLGVDPNFKWKGFYVTDSDQSSWTLSWSQAIGFCNNLDRHGHTDWYLPDISELSYLYDNRQSFGGLTAPAYWSSTEIDTSKAWAVRSSDGFQYSNTKSLRNGAARCVRRG